MGRKITLKGLVLLLESLELIQLTVTEVTALEHLLLAMGPSLVDLCLVLELLGQVFQPLQPGGKGQIEKIFDLSKVFLVLISVIMRSINSTKLQSVMCI